MKSVCKHMILFFIGGAMYYGIEVLWRGHSHWTMFLVGGFCFILIGLINEVFPSSLPLVLQMTIASALVTVVELVAGLFLNGMLGLQIWDYSMMPFNLFGQVCLQYTVLWFFLALPAIVLEDWMHHWFFGEEKPHYVLV